jgi:hypothetical protein
LGLRVCPQNPRIVRKLTLTNISKPYNYLLEIRILVYSLLYRLLPGGKLAKIIQMSLLVIGSLVFLVFVAFPFIDSLIPEDPALDV